MTYTSSLSCFAYKCHDKNAALIHPVVKQTVIYESGKSSKIKQNLMA